MRRCRRSNMPPIAACLAPQLKLARGYAAGNNLPQDDAKAFFYFQQIANQHADIVPSSPVAKYVGEAFVALGQYYVDGVPAMSLAPAPGYAAKLFRHAASYFGNAEAQYRLAQLYLVRRSACEKNVGLAANWLAAAAKKQTRGRTSDARRTALARRGRSPAAGEGACPDHARA